MGECEIETEKGGGERGEQETKRRQRTKEREIVKRWHKYLGIRKTIILVYFLTEILESAESVVHHGIPNRLAPQ